MGMAAGGSKGGHKSDINVTPLVDVCLVLLIIFMVVTPMLQRGKEVTLPEVAKKSEHGEKNPEDPLIISLTKDKRMWLEKDNFDAHALTQKLKDVIAATPTKPIMLKADTTLTYGDVRKVMAIAQDAGAKGVKLGVQEEGKKQ
jgi:biopolymer transport protein TolR